MEGNRSYRRARQAEALAEATANELLLEECRKEVRKQKKEKIGVAFVKTEKPSESLSGPDRVRVQVTAPQAAQVL